MNLKFSLLIKNPNNNFKNFANCNNKLDTPW